MNRGEMASTAPRDLMAPLESDPRLHYVEHFISLTREAVEAERLAETRFSVSS